MTEQAKVPAIRFAGFTDPWEQRKFSELASLRRGLTYSPADIRPYGQGIRVLRSSNIDEDEFTLSNEDVFVDETVVGIELVQEGEILITAANGSPRLVGKRAIINGLTGKTVHGGFMLCAHAEQPDYVAALMGSRWYQHFLATGVAGGNGSIGNLDKAALEDEFAFVPSIEEQELIGVLFSRLDDLITLHQRKYDKLVVFKKSMLEKMFPKDGESVPEIRFAGFTDPWEQRKLGELSSEFQSGDFISAEKILASGPYPVYGGNGLRGYAKRYNHDGFYALIGRQGALCGNVNTAVGKAYFTEHAVAIKANSLHDTRFLVHLLRCMDLGQYSGQSAQPGLAVGVLKEVETTVPSKVEQQAIGSFFSRLDDLITLHQRKLELLQNIKKSLLDKMFV
ncbi:restriction endonuclease subunit S [Bifidobacterium bifidum]|uniref:restriction endonuclease subunit S n=2 Tax=Bifidobacterium bifidum TaxID=1681 RepID=UPI003F64DB01